MRSQRHLLIAGAFVTLLTALFIGQLALERTASAQAKGGAQAPRFVLLCHLAAVAHASKYGHRV